MTRRVSEARPRSVRPRRRQLATPGSLLVLVGGVLLAVAISLYVADRGRQRLDDRVEGELRYATAALPRALQPIHALLFAMDAPGPGAGAEGRLRRPDLRRLEPSLRAFARFERRRGDAVVVRTVPPDLASPLQASFAPEQRALTDLLDRAEADGGGVALGGPVDSAIGRVLVVARVVRGPSRSGEPLWSAAVLGLDAFVAEALEGIDDDVVIRVQALGGGRRPTPVTTYAPAGPVRDADFDGAPNGRVDLADRQWLVEAASIDEPALLSLPVLLAGLLVTGLVLALLLTARRAEGRARTLARGMTARLEDRTRQIEALTENAPDLIGRFDRDHRLVFANTAMKVATGLPVGEVIAYAAAGRPEVATLIATIDRQIELVFATCESRQTELVLEVDSASRDFEVQFAPERDDGNQVRYVLAIARDVTERARAQRDMARRALRDPLTGLANRALVYDRLEHALTRRASTTVALLVVDLDRFKLINDSFGHGAGDSVLVEVGHRLAPLLRGEDTLGRLGGDEFVIVAEVAHRDDAVRLSERIVDALRPPLELSDRRLSVTASVGLAVAEGGTEHAHDLLRAADAAMYHAKGRGGDGCAVFDQSMRTHARDRLALEHDIRAGTQRGAFVPYYQPMVGATEHRVVGYEALARWHRQDGTIAGPDQFIDAAEESGLIIELGAGILRQAVRQAAAWHARDRGLRVWVNLSARQLTRPDFLETVLAIFDEEQAECATLGFELTETTIAHGPQHVRETLTELRRLGARVAIDDFGVGYSSLSRIKELPIDEIKIDRSFIAGVGSDPNDTALVEAVIRLARARGAGTIAEGIETEQQAHRLAELGCDTLQGFYFGRPAAADVIGAPASGPVAGRRGA